MDTDSNPPQTDSDGYTDSLAETERNEDRRVDLSPRRLIGLADIGRGSKIQSPLLAKDSLDSTAIWLVLSEREANDRRVETLGSERGISFGKGVLLSSRTLSVV